MSSLDEFGALIKSLEEYTGEYLKKLRVGGKYRIFSDKLSGSAHIEICLDNPSWGVQSAAIDQMIEIRSMFLDDISIDYAFVDGDQVGATTTSPRTHRFVAA